MHITSMQEWIEQLRSSEKLILVEGQNDKKVLEQWDIPNILTVTKKPTYKVVEEIEATKKEVVILTDLDPEGKKYYATLRHELQKKGIKIDHVFREYLLKEKKPAHIEDLKED